MSEKPTIHDLEQILDEDDPGKVTIQPDGSVVVKTLEEELTEVLNRHCAENPSNTPDYILAGYLMACLDAFNVAVQMRETWHGRDARPSEPPS